MIPQSRQTIFDHMRTDNDADVDQEQGRLKYRIADINSKYLKF